MSAMETIIAPRHVWEIPLTIPGPGVLKLRVASELPVDSFLVNIENRDAYRQGRPFTSWYANHASQLHSRDIPMQFPGQWFLLVHNKQTVPVRVQADLTFVPVFPTPTGFTGSVPTGFFGR